jgi:hypothetical protein
LHEDVGVRSLLCVQNATQLSKAPERQDILGGGN